ncbi:MAG TPA: alpha/beta hydrolase [Candidatus Hydrogenedentes bacterium]|nr:alpha/beta hydrolase [Candidatus Hydrogenedentota bacterium]
MPSTFSLSMAKWVLDLASKIIKADVRLHNASAIQDNTAIIFTVNHFTRLETLLLPYVIYKHTGREVMSLAAAELFTGRIGKFMESTGSISTKAPDRDKIIVRSLLNGLHPWIIFPEGAMIKDKKVVDHKGLFQVYNNGQRRPPHKGAAVLALRAEFYRHKIQCILERPDKEELPKALEMFGLTSAEEIVGKRTVIVPVNITYFPMRAHENILLRMGTRFAQDLSKRALEELSVEGTILSEDTDIDVTLGDPIDVADYLNAPEYAEIMACGLHDMHDLEMDPASLFNDAARKLMLRYMKDIYQHTTVNYDHLFAGMLRYYPARTFTEHAFRDRVFLCAKELKRLEYRVHTVLQNTFRDMVYEEDARKLDNFLKLCIQEGVLRRNGNEFTKIPHPRSGDEAFQTKRARELTEVIANEIEPLSELNVLIKRTARTPHLLAAKWVRDFFLEEDIRCFEEEYAKFYDPKSSKGPDVGRPFLLRPMRMRGGVVLAHGYMAAPLEVRALAEYLYQHGYAVYGVRLKGHGTSPEDLAQVSWKDWYESFNRGYAVIKTLTENIFLGGFSTGGCLALIAAAQKGMHVSGVFSICAPLKLQNYSVRLAPSLVTLNSLLKRIGRSREGWDYVENDPENKHINYTRNPLTGVSELIHIMDVMDERLPEVNIPALVVQGSKDPTVNPVSAQLIFEKIASSHKELTILERNRHGIINGAGREEVFERVSQFLRRVSKRSVQSAEVIPAAAG